MIVLSVLLIVCKKIELPTAKLVLGKALYEYVASGTDDEQSEHLGGIGALLLLLLFNMGR